MKIAIIGGGAIGLLTASYLAEVGHEMMLFTRMQDQASIINEQGIERIKKGSIAKFHMKAEKLTGSSQLNDYQVVFVCVKQYDNAIVLPLLQHYSGKIIFMQNGYVNLHSLSEWMATKQLYLGIIEHGAVRFELNHVHHHGIGKVRIGGLPLAPAFELQTSADFPIEFSDRIIDDMMDKLVINAVINPITAVYKVSNGELLRRPRLIRLTEQLCQEVCRTLNMSYQEKLEKIRHICNITSENHSSMLVDIQNKRLTEVDVILGYIAEEARIKQIAVPLIDTFYAQIRALEVR